MPVAAAAHTEHRMPVLATILAAFALHVFLPSTITFFPSWIVPVAGVIILTPLVLLNPSRMNLETRWSRWIGILFAALLAGVNQVYIVRLIIELVDGDANGPSVLLTALAVWITNVVAFALVYWELDGGGPVARRVEGVNDTAPQDFRFPQQDDGASFDPVFFDYAFFSLSNMMAFSPTDTMPLTLRAKGLMAYQAFTGFVLLALVISRAVNILT